MFKGVLPWYLTCICCILIRLILFIAYSFSVALLPVIQLLFMQIVLPSSYTDTMYFGIIHYHSLFLSCFPLVPSERPTTVIIFLSLCIYKIMYVFMYISISTHHFLMSYKIYIKEHNFWLVKDKNYYFLSEVCTWYLNTYV
jgi:hypothetical protein